MIKMITEKEVKKPKINVGTSKKTRKSNLMRWIISVKPNNLYPGYLEHRGEDWEHVREGKAITNDLNTLDSSLKDLRSELEYKFLQNPRSLSVEEFYSLERLRYEFNKLTKVSPEAKEVSDRYEQFLKATSIF